MKTRKEQKDVYEMINEIILEKLQQGTMPWKKSWNTFGPARNYVTNKPYRGFNALLLGMISGSFEYPLYVTFNQVKQLGGFIKKGSKSLPVIYWKMLYYSSRTSKAIAPEDLKKHDPDDVNNIPLLRYYSVFNIDCAEGIEFKLPGGNYINNPIERCESIIQEMPNRPAIKYSGSQPCYNAVTDEIKIPKINNFTSEAEYYAALFHELGHSTGHISRLNRETLSEPAFYASKNYCQEELVAEIASCFVCNEAGIMNETIDNSASFIDFWQTSLKEILKEDKRFFIKASSEAQKAADYILNRIEEKELIPVIEEVEGT